MGGVAMCHKKAGNEEGTRRARANLKDVHWCVTFVYRKLRLISPTLLDVTCCVRLHILLHVVRSCCATLKPVKLFSEQLSTFLLFHDGESVAQARALHMVYKVLWVVSFPLNNAGPNIVGRCCIR